MKILVIEDQIDCLKSLNFMIQIALFGREKSTINKEYAENELVDAGIAVARCYNDAKKYIEENEYDVIFLDHRMPCENMCHLEYTEKEDQISDAMKNIGYSLITLIKKNNHSCVVIGTSSMKNIDLGSECTPDYILNKISWDPSGLKEIFEKI